MNKTKEKSEREVYIAPVVTDIAPVTVTKGQAESPPDKPGDNEDGPDF